MSFSCSFAIVSEKMADSGAAAYAFFAAAELSVVVTVACLVQLYAAKEVKPEERLMIGVAWLVCLSIVAVIPVDVHTALMSSQPPLLAPVWRILYWATFALTWLVLPIHMGYGQEGHEYIYAYACHLRRFIPRSKSRKLIFHIQYVLNRTFGHPAFRLYVCVCVCVVFKYPSYRCSYSDAAGPGTLTLATLQHGRSSAILSHLISTSMSFSASYVCWA